MAARYFKDPDGAVSVYVALADTGAGVLADAGLAEITAEEYQAQEARQAEAAAALLAPATPATSSDETKEARRGRDGRERRR
ncbi:hypothetical protein ABTX34_28995 [Streptomyces sp. NPDC096538]|uniref:hypothetical protein n=1 Tax=Streptomyces sp. NPDC096538 TaxID=3155427 RepID=UPI003332F0E8